MTDKKRYSKKDPWVRTSREMRELVDHCVVCLAAGDEVQLVVHHVRYRQGRQGLRERPQDVVVICSDCHDDIHKLGFDGPVKFTDYRDQVRALRPLP